MTTYSIPPDWLGDHSRQGTPLFGGNLPNTLARYYRVRLCAGDASNCQHTLIRVN